MRAATSERNIFARIRKAYALLLLVALLVSLSALTINVQPSYAQTTAPVCPCLDCPNESILGNIHETVNYLGVPAVEPQTIIDVAPPPVNIGWTDLLNPDGSSKGQVNINPTSDIWMSATWQGKWPSDAPVLIYDNGLRQRTGGYSTLTITLSDSFDLSGFVYDIGATEYVESDALEWSNLINMVSEPNNRLAGTSDEAGMQGSATYSITNVNTFQVKLGNTDPFRQDQFISVPQINLPAQDPGPTYTTIWGEDGAEQIGAGLIPEFAFVGYMSGYKEPALPQIRPMSEILGL